MGVAAVVLLVLVAGVVARAATEATPRLRVTPILADSVSFPGPPPAWAWPSQGEAAAEVSGVGLVGTHGPKTAVPVASLAKMMTAYVVLQDHPVAPGQAGFTVTINGSEVADYRARQAEAQSVLAVTAGEQLTELQLLEGLLVASGNNVAPILAVYDSGSVPAFVARMNSTARLLGMTKTTYTDPSGLTPSTVSTAADQLDLIAHAMSIPTFARIVDMRSVTLPVAGTVPNFNTAVGRGGYVGIKTGSDSEAGGCLAFANRRQVGGRQVIILGVILGQDVGQALTSVLVSAAVGAATSLVRSVLAAVSVRSVLGAGTPVATVSDAEGRQVTARAVSSLSLLGWGGLVIPLKASLVPLGTGLRAGQRVGTVSIVSDRAATSIVSSAAGMPRLSWSWRLRHIF